MIEVEMGLVYFGVGVSLAALLPGVGSAIGTAIVGQAAGPILEKDEEKFGNLLVLEALPGTQGIYGLLIAVVMLLFSGLMEGEAGLDKVELLAQNEVGMRFIFAGLPIAIVGFVSAIFQGKLAAVGVSIVDKKPGAFGKAIIIAAMVETFAVLALLVSILMLIFWATPVVA